MGANDQERIGLLRSFKKEVIQELEKNVKSHHYAGSQGEYASSADWNFDELLAFFQGKFKIRDSKFSAICELSLLSAMPEALSQ